MKTALDTNVLLDLVSPDSRFTDWAVEAVRSSLAIGEVVVSEAVYAECGRDFAIQDDLDRFLLDVGVRLERSENGALFAASQAWLEYLGNRPDGLICSECSASTTAMCRQCGATLRGRQHVIADFLIGAHALIQTDRLITRDIGYFRTYFPELPLISN